MSEQNYHLAVRDFQRARQEAAVKQLLRRFTGDSDELLAYNSVSRKLGVTDSVERGLSEIPIGAIVGSVGRADDFTRDFLPKRDSDAERWARVKAAVLDMKGWPPIDVYQISDVYFVIDGNHRVSVARQLGSKTITAHVIEVETELPFTAAEEAYTAICKTNYHKFLEQTRIREQRPEAALYLTYCHQYQVLLDQIDANRSRLDGENGHDVSFEQAAVCWYDDVYVPVLQIVREQGILQHFSDRTEADIYVLLTEKRQQLEDALGWHIDERAAVLRIGPELEPRSASHLNNIGQRLRAILHPNAHKGPETGAWRREMEVTGRGNVLFHDTLVSLQGTDADWLLLEKALRIAQRENGRILALHAMEEDGQRHSSASRRIREQFQERIQQAGVRGELAFAVGSEGQLMLRRATYVDLVATNLTFETHHEAEDSFGKETSKLIQHCPGPILVDTAPRISPMSSALLAYDGSPKSDEALFVAAYIAARWDVQLSVTTVGTKQTAASALDRAQEYLTCRELPDVNYVLSDGEIWPALSEALTKTRSEMLIIGGFGHQNITRQVLGSTVLAALRSTDLPILICR